MRATIDAASLRELADFCARIVPAKPHTPILAAVHLGFTADGLTGTVTDYDTFGRATAPVVTDTETTLAVSARLLAQVATAVAGKGNARVELEHDPGGRLRLACRSMRAALPVLPVEDFPAWPAQEPSRLRAVAGALLAPALEHALAAAARDDTLPNLYAVLLESTPGGLRVVATDRYRCPVAELPWLEPPADRDHSTVLVTRPAAAVMARSAKAAERVMLGFPGGEDGKTVLFGTPGRVVLSRLLDNAFPKYRTLFPDGAGRTWTADSDDLAALAKSVGDLSEGRSDEGERRVRLLRATVGGGQLTVTAEGDSEAAGSIDVEHSPEWDHDPWVFGVNAAFLADAVAAIPCPRVKFTQTTASKPLLVGPDGDATYTASGLLMPIRITAEMERAA